MSLALLGLSVAYLIPALAATTAVSPMRATERNPSNKIFFHISLKPEYSNQV